MGNYNPHIPFILGQEWVPIRDEEVVFSPSVNAVEYGHQFVLNTSKTLQHGKFYSSHPPMYTGASGQVWIVSVYPLGTESLSGPVSRLVIPCTNATATGGGITPTGTVTSYLQNPSSSNGLLISGSTGGGQIDMSFGFNLYPILNGKRILSMNFLYLIQDFVSLLTADIGGSQLAIGPNTTAGAGTTSYGTLIAIGNTVPLGNPESLALGDVNRVAYSNVPSVTEEMAPWNYTNLVRLVPAAASGLHFTADFRNIVSTQTIVMNYAALEVFYCEEQRIAYGARGFIDFGQNFNRVTMRTCPGQVTNPVLSPGRYTVTVATMDPGNYAGGVVRDDPPGTVNGVRELYALTDQAGVKIQIPFPLNEDAVGRVFVAERSTVLPQLSLHTSGATVDEVHAYGKQAISQVYGSITATQEIFDTTPGTASYPQVRFVARRFGDTTVPLRLDSPTITGSNFLVEITPTEFDALDEIAAGWKEVTLRFPATGPIMGTGTNPQWRWSATGEVVGNRWEVLGAIAPALSGVPGNPLNQVPSTERLTTASYGALTAGSTINLGWIPGESPVVTSTTDDPMSDAMLIFAQDLPTITGFSVATTSQEVVGIGLDCGIDPCCIPTDILYNQITWALPVNTGVATDLFDRTVAAGGWGTASDGKSYTTSGTAANFSVNGSQGVIVPSALGASRMAWLNVGGPDQDVKTLFEINDLPESGALVAGLSARLTDASNLYRIEFRYQSGTDSDLRIRKTVAGVTTTLLTVSLPNLAASTTRWMYMRLQIKGATLMAKVWGVDTEEPDWILVTTDTDLTTGNNAGVIARDDTGATSSTFLFDNFTVRVPDYWFGSYELQRQDTIDTDWQTIMRATGPSTTGFKDYEARVGVVSSYRIRGVDVYDFAGPWSSEVSATIPNPGASGSCLSDGHILIFTSNERQDGSINLAYSSVWEDRVQEDFVFPEAGFVQMQAMYNRDFFTAFRPTERGGGQFSRNVLVQAAAISPPTLADFTSLRDMAWDNVSYICVRDEDGNRWFATVLVPGGRVTHSRKLYIAPVTVIEVTDTPSEADPS